MTKVTIDRALIEQAIEALLPEQLGVSHFALRQKLRSALADPAVEPVTRAVEVLKTLEWQEIPHEYRPSEYFCPVCDRYKRQGHEPGCALAAALTEPAVEELVIDRQTEWVTGAELASPPPPAEPEGSVCPTCISLSRAVMLDQTGRA